MDGRADGGRGGRTTARNEERRSGALSQPIHHVHFRPAHCWRCSRFCQPELYPRPVPPNPLPDGRTTGLRSPEASWCLPSKSSLRALYGAIMACNQAIEGEASGKVAKAWPMTFRSTTFVLKIVPVENIRFEASAHAAHWDKRDAHI